MARGWSCTVSGGSCGSRYPQSWADKRLRAEVSMEEGENQHLRMGYRQTGTACGAGADLRLWQPHPGEALPGGLGLVAAFSSVSGRVGLRVLTGQADLAPTRRSMGVT